MLKEEFTAPSDDFIKFLLSDGDIYEGRLMQNVVDRFRPIVKKSISQYINEVLNDRIKSALNTEENDLPESEIVVFRVLHTKIL